MMGAEWELIAVADTNADPRLIQHVIPGNDDDIRAIKLFCAKIADACLEGARLGKSRAVNEPEHLWVLVGQLRKKLEPDPASPRYLISEPWVGYRFATEPE